MQQIFYDLNTPHEYRSKIMYLFRKLEAQKGPEYMKDIPDNTYYELARTFAKKYELQRHADQSRLGEPGTSGAHRDPGVQGWHPDAAFQSEFNLAHEKPHRLTAPELAGHYHPDVQRMYNAVRKDKPGHLRDAAVVWDSEDRPYYFFARLHKTGSGEVPASADGTRTYEVVIPATMDFRTGRAITEGDWKKYHKGQGLQDTDFRRVMRNAHSMSVLQKVKAPDFDSIIAPLQHKAWKRASVFWHWWQLYQQSLQDIDELENRGVNTLLTPEERGKLRARHLVHDIRRDILLGKMPQAHHPDEQEMKKWHISKQLMGESYTWYLWLLISEQEYGIRLPERRALYPGYPTTPTELKGEAPFWSIRPEQREGGERKWNKDLLKGLGYSVRKWDDFIRQLTHSNYRMATSEGELQRLWVPVVSNSLLKRWGVKFHPVNITDYLDIARTSGGVKKRTGPLLGKVGGNLAVHQLENVPQYVFIPPGGTRKLALIPALGYLQKFDSPAHGGERLVHDRVEYRGEYNNPHRPIKKPKEKRTRARGFNQPPNRTNLIRGGLTPGPASAPTAEKARRGQYSFSHKLQRAHSPISDKTRARAEARRAKKFAQTGRFSFRYDPQAKYSETLQRDLALANRLVQKQKAERERKAKLKKERPAAANIRTNELGSFQRDMRYKSVVGRSEYRPTGFNPGAVVGRIEKLANRPGRIVRTGDNKIKFTPREKKVNVHKYTFKRTLGRSDFEKETDERLARLQQKWGKRRKITFTAKPELKLVPSTRQAEAKKRARELDKARSIEKWKREHDLL